MTTPNSPEAPATEPVSTMLTTPSAETPKGEGTEAAPAPESKPADEGGKAGSAVEEPAYDLKLPEGSALDPERVKALTEFAKANKLSPENAQALLHAEHELVNSLMAGVDKEMETLSKNWESEVKAKYGENLTKNLELAKRALARFDRSNGALTKALDETGYGNHPLLVDLLVAIGETMSEDSLVPPGGTPTKNESKSTAEIFYSKQK